MPALPFSPVKFSGLIERDLALEIRNKFPRFKSSPSNWPLCAFDVPVPHQATNAALTRATEVLFMIRSSKNSLSFRYSEPASCQRRLADATPKHPTTTLFLAS
jgi:hypothetical protein